MSDWIASPNWAKQQTWFEETVMQQLFDRCGSDGRPPMPHLILYGRSASGRTAWADLQQQANETCHADANCQLRYVQLPELPEPPVASNFSIWGHWAHVENPLAIREEIEAFV
eukprot:452897-Prymnesium_polylepis.1